MKKLSFILLLLVVLSCGKDNGPGYQEPYDPNDDDPFIPLSDTEMMDLTQQETFKYFWDYAESNSGAARERYHPNDPSNSQNVVTTGGSGFGLC